MSKFKRYERYKDSGVEWIGEIPEHWGVNKIKFTTYVKGRIGWQGLRADEFIDEGPYLVTGTDFIDGLVNWGSCYHISMERYNEAPPIQLRENDLLITKDGTIGKVAIVKNKPKYAILNSGIFVTRPQNSAYLTEFMYWILNSQVFNRFIEYMSLGSTIVHLYQQTFENFSFPITNLKEQKTIVDFLNKKTSEIDDLIADKEKLIELLQEKRQAVITEAVTKGLNPNVRMKDSGIEWIGEIPEHWDIRRIKYLANVRNIKASDSDNDKTYVGLENIESRTGKLLLNRDDEQQLIGETANIFKKGDVLFGKLRPYLAKCIIADFDGRCTSELLVLRTTTNILPEYLYFLILSPKFIDIVNSSTYGAKMPRASWDFIGNLEIPLPSIKEQEEIVEYLLELTRKVDELIFDISTQIQKLKEYRQSLISEAVTGKIDVRDYKDEEMSNLNLIKKVERRVSRMKNETIYLDRDMNQRFEKEFEAAKKDWEKDKQEYEKQKRDNDKKQF
jgi:restriction endonuclease S subunit